MEIVIGSSLFRSSHSDHLLQKVVSIAHSFPKQEEEPSPCVVRLVIYRAFGTIVHALDRRASSRDLQGVVRR